MQDPKNSFAMQNKEENEPVNLPTQPKSHSRKC